MSDEDDIDLASLSDDELVEQMHDDLYDGLQEEITDALTSFWNVAGYLTTS